MEAQKTIIITNDGKSVRLDVYVYVEDENRIFNLEMQATNNEYLVKRSRFYQAMIDLNTLQKGDSYQELKESYAIFICTFDPFGEEFSRYTFRTVCLENSKRMLEDDTCKMFFNATAYAKEKDINVRAFLQYVSGKPVQIISYRK